MKKCPNCGRTYADFVTTCSACNTSLSGGQTGGSANHYAGSSNNGYAGNSSNQYAGNSSNNYNNNSNNYNANAAGSDRSGGNYGNNQVQQYNYGGNQNGYNQNGYNQNNQQNNPNDSDSIWWLILGICLPGPALIAYFVIRKEKPKSAKKLLTGAGISMIVSFLLGFFGAMVA